MARGKALQEFNAVRLQRNLLELRRALRICEKRNVEFKTLGSVVRQVAAITRIHRTTLLRNKSYRELLWTFFIVKNHLYEGVSDDKAPPEILRQKLRLAKLDIEKKDAELRELRRAVKELGGEVSVEGDVARANQAFVKFADTATVLALVIERCKGVIRVDLEKNIIEDRAARPSERIIVGMPRVKAFCDWLRASAKVGLFLDVANS